MEGTEQRIIDSAIQTFSEDPSASLDIVATRAGITRRTLNRYFSDREHLVKSCETDMRQKCQEKMLSIASQHSGDPLKLLELMLYAGIDCGTRYVSFVRQHQHPDHQHSQTNKNCSTYDKIMGIWNGNVILLQNLGAVEPSLPLSWIHSCFNGTIANATTSVFQGNVAQNDVKRLAWYSFSRSIGIKNNI